MTTEETATEEAPQTMKPRELAGAINRAKAVLVYVCWGPGENGEGYYQISKESAREIAEHARESKLEITAHMDGRDLFIGPCDEEGPEDEPED